ncbi:MAG: hypothetical protein ACFNKE_06295 [Neisseria elongata]
MASEPVIPAAHPDTVADAAATPEREMPWKELGLKADEYESIRELLGRRPTNAELAMYSVMWSEHCSYKSSKVHLRQFGAKTTPAWRWPPWSPRARPARPPSTSSTKA